MGKIALLPCDIHSRAKYLGNRELPPNYMADFTLMGFVVGQYPKAISLLTSAGYRVDEQEGGAEICVDTPRNLQEIIALMTANGISCDLSDIADTLYQA